MPTIPFTGLPKNDCLMTHPGGWAYQFKIGEGALQNVYQSLTAYAPFGRSSSAIRAEIPLPNNIAHFPDERETYPSYSGFVIGLLHALGAERSRSAAVAVMIRHLRMPQIDHGMDVPIDGTAGKSPVLWRHEHWHAGCRSEHRGDHFAIDRGPWNHRQTVTPKNHRQGGL